MDTLRLTALDRRDAMNRCKISGSVSSCRTFEIGEHSAASKLRRRIPNAFSLIEVALAIGVMSFALLAIFGLLPVGLGIFRNAKDVSVTSQIEERIFSEVKTMTFDNLTKSTRFKPATAGQSLRLEAKQADQYVRYFTEEGEETAKLDATTIYHVNIAVTPSTPFLQVAADTSTENVDLARVTIQIAYNPGNRPLLLDPVTNLWKDAASGGSSNIPIWTYSSYVSRNL